MKSDHKIMSRRDYARQGLPWPLRHWVISVLIIAVMSGVTVALLTLLSGSASPACHIAVARSNAYVLTMVAAGYPAGDSLADQYSAVTTAKTFAEHVAHACPAGQRILTLPGY